MPTACVVYGCNNRHSKGCGISFYHFPPVVERRRQWIAFVNRRNPDGTTWQPGKDDRLCSDHFIRNEKSDIPINPDYVPTIKPNTDQQAASKDSVARYERAKHRSQASEQARRVVEMEREATLARRHALYEAFKHDHGLYCKKSPPPQVQPRDNLLTCSSNCETMRSPSPTVPAEVG